MAIFKMTGKDAVRTLKRNKASRWGNRILANRVEPIAAPIFDVPFHLDPGEKIFTIGSCFARNVEAELIKRGFEIPMWNLFSTSEFEGVDPAIVNNFGTPSIYNEIAWAFEEMPFDEEAAFLKVGRNKYTDLHVVSDTRPEPLEILKARRERLFQVTRSLADCRVLIMTLGLVEIWWDEESQLYLNAAPPRAVLRKTPDRFSLHVLGVEECIEYLQRAFTIIFKHGREDLRVILTVSPVPMMATHRPVDVMAANTFSKSVLRVVAEYIVAKYDQVTYFPSYETVTLSDRQLAWMDDLVHVREEMVAFNVERMVDAFSGKKLSDENQPSVTTISPETVKAKFLAEKARQARLDGNDAFFEENLDQNLSSPAFAMEYAQLLYSRRKYDEALAIIEQSSDVDARLLEAQCLIGLQRYNEAAETAHAICRSGHKGMMHWRILLDALTKAGTTRNRLEEVESDWLSRAMGAAHAVKLYSGMALRKSGFTEAALSRLKFAAEDSRSAAISILEYANCHLDLGNAEAAIATLKGFKGENSGQDKAAKDLIQKARNTLESQRD